MATRVLRTPSVLLVNDALDERDLYARTVRAYGYQVAERNRASFSGVCASG
jgi:hypothetical protein